MNNERLRPIPKEEMERLHQEALEINQLVDELREQEKEISSQEAAERIIAEREITDLDKEKFAKGWGEKMMREILELTPEVQQVEPAPKETDEQRKTDAFLVFEKGRVAVQFTFVGFEERGSNDLKNKFKSVLERESTTYRGQEEVPLTMVRSNEQKFLEAFGSWEANGRKGRATDYLPRREWLANELIRTMALVFIHKSNIRHNAKDKDWSDYLMQLYSHRQKELATLTK